MFASCFCCNAVIFFAFFFYRAFNCSLNPCIIELSSMAIDLNAELLVVTIYFCDQRKFHLGLMVAPNVLNYQNLPVLIREIASFSFCRTHSPIRGEVPKKGLQWRSKYLSKMYIVNRI